MVCAAAGMVTAGFLQKGEYPMKAALLLTFTYLAVLTLLIGCRENQNNATQPDYSQKANLPVVVNDSNQYVFTLEASHFSVDRTDSLFFSTRSLIFPLTVVNYTSGSGEISVYDKDESIVLTEKIDGNKVITRRIDSSVIPDKINIELNDFSGTISLVLKER